MSPVLGEHLGPAVGVGVPLVRGQQVQRQSGELRGVVDPPEVQQEVVVDPARPEVEGAAAELAELVDLVQLGRPGVVCGHVLHDGQPADDLAVGIEDGPCAGPEEPAADRAGVGEVGGPAGERGAIGTFEQVHALRRERVAHQHAGEIVGIAVGGQRFSGSNNQPQVVVEEHHRGVREVLGQLPVLRLAGGEGAFLLPFGGHVAELGQEEPAPGRQHHRVHADDGPQRLPGARDEVGLPFEVRQLAAEPGLILADPPGRRWRQR